MKLSELKKQIVTLEERFPGENIEVRVGTNAKIDPFLSQVVTTGLRFHNSSPPFYGHEIQSPPMEARVVLHITVTQKPVIVDPIAHADDFDIRDSQCRNPSQD